MVTADPDDEVEKNLVVWEKSSSAPILSYNIYRENYMAGDYTKIGSVHFENLSEYLDEDNISFTILGDMLVAVEMFDYEVKDVYSIRIRCTDKGNLSREEIFTI